MLQGALLYRAAVETEVRRNGVPTPIGSLDLEVLFGLKKTKDEYTVPPGGAWEFAKSWEGVPVHALALRLALGVPKQMAKGYVFASSEYLRNCQKADARTPGTRPLPSSRSPPATSKSTRPRRIWPRS